MNRIAVEVEPTLEALMERVAGDDDDAFEQLYQRVSPRLIAKLSASSRDREQVRDVVQTTFMKIYRARHSYERGAPVLPWITVVAKRTLIDEWRPLGARLEVLSSDGRVPDSGDGHTIDPQELLALQRALSELPVQYRDAIELTKIGGLSGQEAADRLQTTTAALKQRVRRGLSQLRSLLEPVMDEPVGAV